MHTRRDAPDLAAQDSDGVRSGLESAAARATPRAGASIRSFSTAVVSPRPWSIAPPKSEHACETFVVGTSKCAAFAAARAVASDTAQAALFLHGPSGVGKSHLLHAIFHALDARGRRAVCLPAARIVSA